MNKIHSILFVCTGNSCRSVMAEGLLKKRLKESGKNIEVRSAGIGAVGGMPPTPETVEVMKREGVDVSMFKTKHINEEMIRDAGLIFVMEELHRHEVITRVPEAASKTYLLKEFGRSGKTGNGAGSIHDPIGRPIEYYRACLEDINKEIDRIARLL